MEEEEYYGIDNVQIGNFIKKSGNNISKNFVGVFPADEKRKKKQVQRYKYRNQEQRSKIFIYDCKH